MKPYVKFPLAALVLTMVFYIAGSLIYSSAYDHRLAAENHLYKKHYQQMLSRTELLKDAIAGMQIKDDKIHNDLFGTNSPDIRHIIPFDLTSSEDVPEQRIQRYIMNETDNMEESTALIEKRFEDIFKLLSQKTSYPPMLCPIKDVSYSQIGASIGTHFNPVYKMETEHEGIDIIATIGTPVVATASGVVTTVGHSIKSKGNLVVIEHPGGYVTRYSHLTDIKVHKQQKVSAGQVIASVGMSGATYLPHLHYEVEKDGVIVDPAGYFFASFDPEEYEKMIYMAKHTAQTFD